MTTPAQDPTTGRWTEQHGVRALQEERRQHHLGVPLSVDTWMAIGERVEQYLADRPEPNTVERSMFVDMALCDAIRDASIDEAARRKTLFDSDGALLPVFKTLATYLNSKRLHAVALGIRVDRADKVPSLATYLAEKAAERAAATEPATIPDTPIPSPADTPPRVLSEEPMP
jgi:hypothetical protein